MTICFTTIEERAYSETFIRKIRDILPGRVVHCYGEVLPNRSENGTLTNYRRAPIRYRILKKAGVISSPLNVHFLKEFLKREKFDLVFANYGPSGGAIAPLCKELGIKLIVHFHGADASVRSYFEDPQYNYRGLLATANAIIVVSKAMRDHLTGFGADINKLHLIPYSPNELFLTVNPAYESRLCIATGRFVEKKAPYLTLLAFARARKVVPDLKIRMVGDGDLLPVCRRLVQSLHIEGVEFTGVQTPDQIRKHLSASMMFIQHSIRAENGDQEGTPVAILEASAAALPVIATNHAGIPDVIKHGENGFLVDEGDIDQMSEYIIRLAQDPALARAMGENGRRVVKATYSDSDYKDAITGLVGKVMNGD